MDIIEINALDRSSICAKSNHTKLECQNSFDCINRRIPCMLVETGNMEKRITEIKYTRNVSFP